MFPAKLKESERGKDKRNYIFLSLLTDATMGNTERQRAEKRLRFSCRALPFPKTHSKQKQRGEMKMKFTRPETLEWNLFSAGSAALLDSKKQERGGLQTSCQRKTRPEQAHHLGVGVTFMRDRVVSNVKS